MDERELGENRRGEKDYGVQIMKKTERPEHIMHGLEDTGRVLNLVQCDRTTKSKVVSDERELELIHRVDHLVSQVKNVNIYCIYEQNTTYKIQGIYFTYSNMFVLSMGLRPCKISTVKTTE